MNDNLILISGKSTTGKSASLMNLNSPEKAIYLNCENNKKLPFKSGMQQYTVTDPLQVYEAFTHSETQDDIDTIVIDSVTFLMSMFENLYVNTAPDGRKAWGDYARYFQNLMQQYVAKSTKNVIMLAHTADMVNEDAIKEVLVKVKGSLMNTGIESFFSNVISTKRVSVKTLEDYENPLLTITEDDEDLGFKHVFQTRLTRDTRDERIRSPIKMWDKNETYINNDVQLVIDRLHAYYS